MGVRQAHPSSPSLSSPALSRAWHFLMLEDLVGQQPGSDGDAEQPDRREELLADICRPGPSADQAPTGHQRKEAQQLGAKVVDRVVAGAQLIVGGLEGGQSRRCRSAPNPPRSSEQPPTHHSASSVLEACSRCAALTSDLSDESELADQAGICLKWHVAGVLRCSGRTTVSSNPRACSDCRRRRRGPQVRQERGQADESIARSAPPGSGRSHSPRGSTPLPLDLSERSACRGSLYGCP